jgi:GT2 family glycosyltransferase
MLVRRDLIERIGGLDERFWAYCEDVDLCWRAWQAGYKVLFCPNAFITHKVGRSSDQRLVPSLIQHHKSMWLFCLKNYRHRYPLLLFPLIGLGILLRLAGALLKVASHRLRLFFERKLAAKPKHQLPLAPTENNPSENQEP